MGGASYARGQQAEEAARQALAAAGFRILESNYRVVGAEIDVVCRDADGLVFVEVRARGPGGGAPSASLGRSKLSHLMRGVRCWLARHGQARADWRFVVVEVALAHDGHPVSTEIIEEPFVHFPEFHHGD